MPKRALIKVGGDVLLDEAQYTGLIANIQTLHDAGWQVILLHGGGPQVNQLLTKLQIMPKKVSGRRITSEDDLLHVIHAIAGEVNVELTNHLLTAGLPAMGIHGASDIILATKRPPIKVTGVEGLVDFGAVGDVKEINDRLLSDLLNIGLIPVIATLARDNEGNIYNINADTTAVAIAGAMQADLLVMVTAIGGIFRDINDPTTLIHHIDQAMAEQLIADGVIQDGMIAKVEEALGVVEQGVGRVLITSMADKSNMQRLLDSYADYDLGTCIIHPE